MCDDEKLKCPKCGCYGSLMTDDLTVSFECPNCGWGYAGPNLKSIFYDETKYTLQITSFSDEIETIKIVSKLFAINYLEAKNKIKSLPIFVIKGSAIEIKVKIESLKNTNIKFTINPEYKWIK